MIGAVSAACRRWGYQAARIATRLGGWRSGARHIRASIRPSPASGRDLITLRGSECEALTGGAPARTTSVCKVVAAGSLSRRPTLVHQSKQHFFTFSLARKITMSATDELSGILSRRQEINDKLEEGLEVKPKYKFVNVYTEFHEFSRKEIKQYEETFNK